MVETLDRPVDTQESSEYPDAFTELLYRLQRDDIPYKPEARDFSVDGATDVSPKMSKLEIYLRELGWDGVTSYEPEVIDWGPPVGDEIW
jgi:hypothetical protein